MALNKDFKVKNGLTVTENLSVGGDSMVNALTATTFEALTAKFNQTIVSTTSALSVVNNGSGPALLVQQDGAQPIAHFIDKDGDDIIFHDDGKVSIGSRTAVEQLTVTGNISATGGIKVASTTNGFVSAGRDLADIFVTSSGGVGTVTNVQGLEGITVANGTSDACVTLDLNELTTSTSDGDGDFFAVVDSSGNQKKLTKGNIAITGFNGGNNLQSTLTPANRLSATNIGSGEVSTLEFNQLSGVTSDIQAQINSKLGATCTAADSNQLGGVAAACYQTIITPSNRLSATNIGTGIVDNAEFNFLNGVTSNIQSQLAALSSNAPGDITGITAGVGIAGGGNTGNVGISIFPTQSAITSIKNTSLNIGRNDNNLIKFNTNNRIDFRVGGTDGVTFKPSGEIEATSLDIEGSIDVNGSIETDGLSLSGTNVDASATEINQIHSIIDGQVAASKAVIVDSNKDISGFRNVTLCGELDTGTLHTDTVTEAEFNQLSGVTSDIQAQINSKLGATCTAVDSAKLGNVAAACYQTILTPSNRLSATNIGSGEVSNAEFNQLSSVTSNIQTQINAKQATIDSSNRLNADLIGTSGDVSNAEYEFLDGVTSGIQTQLAALSAGSGGCQGTVTSITKGDGIDGSGAITNTGTIAVDTTVVRTTGDQSIAGTKDFTGTVQIDGTALDSHIQGITVTNATNAVNSTCLNGKQDALFVQTTGDQSIAGKKTFTDNTTITGNLSVLGEFTCIDTSITTTSALSVINAGTGPALTVQQDGSQPIAHFIDKNGDDIIFHDDGHLSIGTCINCETLTVKDSISASNAVKARSLVLNDIALTSTATELNLLDGFASIPGACCTGTISCLGDLGINATAGEINQLDNVAVTSARFNQLSTVCLTGVTIQDQLNAKLGTTATAADSSKLGGVAAANYQTKLTPSNRLSATNIADGSVTSQSFAFLANTSSNIQGQLNAKEDIISASNRINADCINSGDVSVARFNQLSSVCLAGTDIQAQIDAKLSTTATAADSAELGGVAAACYQTKLTPSNRLSATNIGSGEVSTLEFNQLSGVTSDIQAQINSKLGATCTAADSNQLGGVAAACYQTKLTPSNRLSATNIGTGIVDNTEFNYLDGVTSGIQAQLQALSSGAGGGGTVTSITAGDGISTAGSNPITGSGTINIDAAQTTITSILNTSLNIGRDSDNSIKFGNDNCIKFHVAGGENVLFKADGLIEACSLDISGNVETNALSINDVAVTATAAELNQLDEVVVVPARFNQLSSVCLGGTDIQAQINAKTSNTGTVDTIGTPIDTNFAKFTDSNTLSGRSAGAVRSDLSINNVENKSSATIRSEIVSGDIPNNAADTSGNAATATLATNATNATNAASAAVASHIVITDNESTNENNEIPFIEGAQGPGSCRGLESDSGFNYNPSTGTATADKLAGTIQTAAQPNVTSLGTLTTLAVDDVTINGAEIAAVGDLEIDVAGNLTIDAGTDIILDADGGDICLKDGGTEFGRLQNSGSDFVIQSIVSDKDIVFKGNDGGASITALTLDMSDAGTATFNHNVNLPDGGQLNIGANADLYLTHDDNNGYFYNNKGDLFIDQTANNADIVFKGTDNTADITALTLDMSDAGTATFNNDIITDGSICVNRLAGGTPFDNFKISTADIVTTLERVENTGDANAGYGRIDFKTNATTGGTAGRGGFKFIDGDGVTILYLENNDGSATFVDKVCLGNGKLVLNGTAVNSTATELNQLDDVVVIPARFNQLSSINIDGTDIQAQINAKTNNTGTVTSVTAGTGMTQSGTNTINPTLNVIGATDGGICVSADAVCVDSTVVRTTGAQTIGGAKTFTSPVCVAACIVHSGDSNTHIKFNDDCIRLTTGSDGQFTVTNTEVIVNEPGNNNDFRVESNTDTHALFVDGSADKVGVGCSTPAQKLAVVGDGLFTSDLTVQGDLNITGDITCKDTIVSITSALSVVNTGTGPALTVVQAGTNPIACFRDRNGDDIIFADDGKVCIGNSKLTINCVTVDSLACELNLVDGSLANTVVNNKAAIYGSGGELAGTLSTAAQPNVTSLGTLGSLTVDNISIDNTRLCSTSGHLTVCGAGDVVLDSSNGDIKLHDDGTNWGMLRNSSSDFVIQSIVSDKDIVFKGNDGGSTVTPLYLDMSDNGAAIFGNRLYIPEYIAHDGDPNTLFGFSGADTFIINTAGTTALTIDSSQDATFASKVCIPASKLVLNGTAVTATAAELNQLDNVVVPSACFNQLSSVTSNVQSQLAALSAGSGGGSGTVTSVTAGAGMTQSGTSTVNPTLNVIGATDGGICVSADAVCVDSTVVRTTGDQSIGGTKNFSSCICVADQLRHTGDFDTRLSFGTDTMQIEAGDCSQICLTTAGTVINEEGKSIDFRVEGDTDTHALFVDGSADKVGIGTASPAAKLDVVGGHIRLDAGQSLQWDNTHERIEQSDGHLEFFVNNGEAMTLDTNGLGIGTTTPTEKLNVKGNIALSGASASAGPHLKLEGTYTTWELENQYTGGATNDMFRIRNTATSSDALVINRSTNYVGIGETSPQYPLHICQSGAATLAIQSNGNDDEGSKLRLIEGSANWMGGYVQYDGADNNFILGVHANNNTTLSDDNPVITIPRDTGNVGIGITGPQSKLHVSAGDIRIDNNQQYLAETAAGGTIGVAKMDGSDNLLIGDGNLKIDVTGTSPRLTIDSAGKVGIGTTSPAYGLDVRNTIYSSVAATTKNFILGDATNGKTSAISTNNDNLIFYNDGSTESMRINSAGNVGIGTTSPCQELTVNGSLSAHRITESDSFCNVKIGNSNVLPNITSGNYNTGIGYNVLTNTTTGSNNTANGYYSMFCNTCGSKNVAIGRGSMEKNTAGSDNVAIGDLTLRGNTTGGANTAIGGGALRISLSGCHNFAAGCNALYNNWGGSCNVAIGFSTLCSNTTGSWQTAVGLCALKNNTTGYGNAAFGNLALCGNTTGVDNVGVGYLALGDNVSGSCNVAVGYQSLKQSVSGTHNFASGACALFSNWGGSCNTSIGYLSLQCNTTGTANAAVGAQSLRCNTTGSNNVALGPISLFKNTTGGDNIALGCNALYGNTTGGCNFAAGTNSLANNLSACYNTAIGQYALLANYGGCNNTAIGQGTLKSNTTGGCNNAFGKYALCSNTTGCHNTAIGCESLKSNTCGFHNFAAGEYSLHDNTTGHYNAAISKNALCANTCGDHNTAIGENALKANTEGCWNIAVGQNSLKDNVDGRSNIAQGYYAMCNNCTGDYNIALGHQALFAVEATNHNVGIGFYAGLNTTGGCNIAIGTQALQSNTTAANNIAIGPYALMCNTTSTGNTAVGQAASCSVTGACNTSVGAVALTNTVGGIQNTAVGHSAARSNITGSGNTTLGVLSLFSNTDGANNTATGFTAGRYASNGSTAVTSPDQSTYIGACARAGSATPTNETVIGYCACGCGNNTTMLGNCDVANAYICGTLNIPALSINGNTAVTSIPGACCLGTTTASNTQTFTNKSGNISQWTNDCSYTNCVGDVTGIDAGTLIDIDDGNTATPTVNVDLGELTDMTQTFIGTDELVVLDAGAQRRKAACEIGLSKFNNDANFSTNLGTVTSVTAGAGMTQSGTSTVNPTLNVIAGAGICVTADAVCVDGTVVRTTGSQSIGGAKCFTSAMTATSITASGTVQAGCFVTGAFMESNAPADRVYPQGTILALNEDGCVVESTQADSAMVFGVAAGDNKAPIVMGAEPVCITGEIEVGDYITTSDCNGHGKKAICPDFKAFGAIIGQAMESGSGDSFTIKAMIRKM